MQKSDGTKITFDVIKVPLFNEDGSRKGLVILGRDITAKKRIEEEIAESREKYRTLSDASFESIFVSEKGICIEQNKTAERNFGYTNEEAIGRYGTDWIAPEDREMVMQNMLSGYEQPYEAMALRKDGSRFPCILRGKMMQYKGKDVRITSLTDITMQKNAEKALRESERRLSIIVQSSPVAMAINDNSLQITMLNEAFTKTFGYTLEDIPDVESWFIKAYPDEIYRESVKQNWEIEMNRFLVAKDKFNDTEVEITCKDGTTRTSLVTAAAFDIVHSNEVLVILYDISERKKAETELKQKMEYLLQFQRVTVGREMMMIELKKEINQLLKSMGKDGKYTIVE